MNDYPVTLLAIHLDRSLLGRIAQAAHDIDPAVAVKLAGGVDEARSSGALYLADVVLIQEELAACAPGAWRPRDAAIVTPVLGLIAPVRDAGLLDALNADLHVLAGLDPDAMRDALVPVLDLAWCRAVLSTAALPLDAEVRSRTRSVLTGSGKAPRYA